MKTIAIFFLAMTLQQNCKSNAAATTNFPNPTPVPKLEAKAKSMDRDELVKRLEKVDPNYAKIAADTNAVITRVPTDYLNNGSIVLIKQFAPTRMTQIYVGLSGDSTFLIGGNPDEFYAFINQAKPSFSNTNSQLDYLKNFLTITESGKGRFLILESIDDVKARPNLSEADASKFKSFQNEFRGVIKAPARSGGDSFVFYVIKNQDLVEVKLKLDENYRVERNDQILENNLLIPYAL